MPLLPREQIKQCILDLANDGKVHNIDELYAYVISTMHLTKDDLAIINPSDYDHKFKNEIRCAKEELKSEGIIIYPNPYEFQLTEDAINQLMTDSPNNLIFDSFSWSVHGNNVAIKTMDKSFFLHHMTGIPKAVRSFFEIHNLSKGETKEIDLVYQKTQYPARIDIDPFGRTRLHFRKEFTKILYSKYPQWVKIFKNGASIGLDETPKIRFYKINGKEFGIEFIDESYLIPDIENEIDDERAYQCNKEGNMKIISSKYYERNPKNRRLAIEIHGLTCAVCGFNFKEMYGDLGHGFIEVHHISPLNLFECETTIDPEKDLITVCSNCHRMLHRNKGNSPLIDELKKYAMKNR